MDFWSQFWPQFAATLIGVLLGVWGALWVNRRQENLQLLEGKQVEEKRKQKILEALITELNYNKEMLLKIKGDFQDDKQYEYQIFNLKEETWRAFSDGGELEWIKDPRLLDSISEVYYWIRSLNSFSDKLYDFKMASYMSDEISTFTKNTWREAFFELIGETLKHIKEGIRELGDNI